MKLVPSTNRINSEQGSAILVAVMFAIVVGIIAATFLQYAEQEMRLVTRTHENTSLMYTSEAGLEIAIWSLNNNDWTGWSSINGGTDKYYSSSLSGSKGSRAKKMKVLVQNHANNPTIYSEARGSMTDSADMVKQMRITYEVGKGAGAGLVAKDEIEFSGQPVVDAYDSAKGDYNYYFNRLDEVTVGTISRSSTALKLSGQVEIYGFAGTGKHKPEISGPNNKIHGKDTESGTNIDWSRVSQDFTFEFPEVEQPEWSGAIKNLKIKTNSTVKLGVEGGATTKYYLDKMDLSGKTVIDVVGPVQIYLKDGMSISGQAYIQISDGGSMELYTPKDISLSGQGLFNKTAVPSNASFFGTVTKAKDQSFDMSGQAMQHAVVYAPYAEVKVSGQGDFCGSVVGYKITYSGQGNFHYDVQLSSGGDGEGGITSWYELRTNAERMDMDAYVAKVSDN